MKTGTAYFGNRILRHAKADMEQLVEQNFTYVVHTYNENDHIFYRKGMQEIVAATHDVGLDVWVDPWGVGRVFGGESFSNFVHCHLDDLQILSDGKPAGAACPMNPNFRKFMHEWIDAAVELGADGLFWDEPHFYLPSWMGGRPNTWGCRCKTCKRLFKEKFGSEMPKELTPEVQRYREDAILDFLTDVIKTTKSKGVKNMLCLLPHEEGEDGAVSQWEQFASIEGLDVFGTDPYFEFFGKPISMVEIFSERVMRACQNHNLEPQLWFQGFKLPKGTEKMQARAIDIAVDFGIRNLAVWGFEACDHITWIRGDNSKAAWKVFVDKFGALRRKFADEADTVPLPQKQGHRKPSK
ncbi:MAG: hypothetical protein V2A74_04875 [bacterium]